MSHERYPGEPVEPGLPGEGAVHQWEQPLPVVYQPGEIVPLRPEIEQPLRDGHKIHAFSSGGGLRVIRIETASGQLVGYGEAPQVEEALEHAALDYQLGHEPYEQQYSGENARYLHYWTGTTEISSPLDGHLRWGETFDAYGEQDGDGIIVSLAGIKFPPEVPPGLQGRVTATMQSETFVERGVTYQAEPYRFPGDGSWGVSIKVVDNPNNIETSSYRYTKTGIAPTFDQAVAAAFEAPEAEMM
ncbi:MAG TPA: hypothetical protein VLH84_00835 [Patescibacteria group bacterium]|nr:hypothetical protein [Patescibacteria group bacterium]